MDNKLEFKYYIEWAKNNKMKPCRYNTLKIWMYVKKCTFTGSSPFDPKALKELLKSIGEI